MIPLNCPVCQAAFKEIVNEGVLIDICTECRGIWLDRGELEKLMDIAREDAESLRVGKEKNRKKSKFESWLEPL
jgi:Zn-finger nucleic acid-binding protein